MLQKYDPVFPSSEPTFGGGTITAKGLTVRQYYAAAALQGIMAGIYTTRTPFKHADLAQEALDMADAMIEAENA